MREVQIVLWCENAHDPKVPAIDGGEHTAVLDGGKPKLFAVCQECDNIVKAFKELMERGVDAEPQTKRKYSRRGSGSAKDEPTTPPDDNRVWCPRCFHGCKSRTGLGQHANRTHGLLLADLEAEAGPALIENPYPLQEPA